MDEDRQPEEESRRNRPGPPAHRGAARGRSALNVRVRAFLLLGVFVAGGAAFDYLGSGEYWKGALAATACAACLALELPPATAHLGASGGLGSDLGR